MKILTILLILASIPAPLNITTSVRPESFGARGDGITDDTQAFNRCLGTGRAIVLSSGKRYLLRDRLDPIKGDSFELYGNEAALIVDTLYPLKSKYEHVFRFEDGSRRRRLFMMSDLSVEFNAGQKFKDKMEEGDTFFISVDNCVQVDIERVKFKCMTQYNNLTFFSTFGVGNLAVKDCNIMLNTLSKQGGCVWVMNQYFDDSQISIVNCVFEQDTMDETACFSASELRGPNASRIKAEVRDCIFKSPCKSPSSGYIMAYNHYKYPADIDIRFTNCRFLASGDNGRKIMSYQAGSKNGFRYATLNTSFEGCEFDFSFDSTIDTGLLSLPNLTDSSCSDYLFSFSRCTFKMHNIHPVIGDRDGNKSGCYEFRNCEFFSDGPLFTKHYNVPTSEIYVSVDGLRKKLVNPDEF